jgi:hypothetical protein
MADGVESIIDKVAPASPSLSVGVQIPGEEFAAALAAVFNFSDKLVTMLNTPAMLAARNKADVQALLQKMDADLLEAQKTGNISKIDKESSG